MAPQGNAPLATTDGHQIPRLSLFLIVLLVPITVLVLAWCLILRAYHKFIVNKRELPEGVLARGTDGRVVTGIGVGRGELMARELPGNWCVGGVGAADVAAGGTAGGGGTEGGAVSGGQTRLDKAEVGTQRWSMGITARVREVMEGRAAARRAGIGTHADDLAEGIETVEMNKMAT